jgi:pentapeptide MXKDX repeat protein
MKSFLPPLFFGALLLATTQAFADDSMQPGAMTTEQHQMMKDCMAEQKAKNSSMSKTDMKSVCLAQMKSKMNSGQMSGDSRNAADDQPTGSPTSTPPPKQ